ncbi:hypothetical protein Btru_065469 [Bulinus truncatus]|nr:hypothetical protein Btru_065469 [Bulinus truncatus]
MLFKLLIIFAATVAVTESETPEVMTKCVIDAFLKVHNEARANVSVPPLVWSDKLISYASDWSARCKFEHSHGDFGENIFATSTARDDGSSSEKSDASFPDHVLVLGLVRDGRVVKGEGIVFDHYYFTHLYELWVMKKTTHQLNVQEESQSLDELSTANITTFDGLL